MTSWLLLHLPFQPLELLVVSYLIDVFEFRKRQLLQLSQCRLDTGDESSFSRNHSRRVGEYLHKVDVRHEHFLVASEQSIENYQLHFVLVVLLINKQNPIDDLHKFPQVLKLFDC